MKLNIILAVLVAVLGWATCKNFKKTQTADAPAVPVEAPKTSPAGLPGWNASRVIEGNNPDSAGTYQVKEPPRMVTVPVDALPPATASHKLYLSSGYWHMNMAFQPSDTTVHHNYQSKWLKFRQDQTFDILIKGKVVDSGRWNWDVTKNELYLSCKDPYINNTWAVTDRGTVMIWKGNTSINVTGIQVRAVNAGALPQEGQ
ncbi:MAG: hypothetical protein L6Q97_17010 [Thermoanaerobaculia bacterium]|nr:hypothetical protein [Thermoanaerobaculia bacterium]